MSTFRLVFLLLALAGTPFAPIKLAQAEPTVNLVPDPGMGLQFALSPSVANDSITEPEHNETTLEARQITGLAVWITHWFPPPQCSNGVCTITSTDDLPHIQINGEGFTVGGRVFGGIYRWPANTLSWGMNINVRRWPGYRDGSFGLHTPVIDCRPFDQTHSATSFAAAYDWSTARWSPVVWLYTGCAVL
ncbi:hypothetical protein BKA64DRAFT_637082 [Cadophora sp. MPI-SDFR-AT-0126]|nr:hypothetical protein BKA64DRAFT_637082 [Leotiomycetes sp. MPI-SDFR-AT-0126]